MQSTDNTQPLVIGCIGAAHGVRGWVTVHSYTEPPENILDYLPWRIKLRNQEQQLAIINSRQQNHKIIVQIEGCNDRDMASTYTGAEILATRAQLPTLPKDEYYWADLLGLTVITLQGQTLGVIEQFFSTGSNDVFAVVGDKRRLLPYLLKQVVIEIDLKQKIMRVDWDPEF